MRRTRSFQFATGCNYRFSKVLRSKDLVLPFLRPQGRPHTAISFQFRSPTENERSAKAGSKCRPPGGSEARTAGPQNPDPKVVDCILEGSQSSQENKTKRLLFGWSHRESNTGWSRIFAGLAKPQATVIPLHYRTEDGKQAPYCLHFLARDGARGVFCPRYMHLLHSFGVERLVWTLLCEASM